MNMDPNTIAMVQLMQAQAQAAQQAIMNPQHPTSLPSIDFAAASANAFNSAQQQFQFPPNMFNNQPQLFQDMTMGLQPGFGMGMGMPMGMPMGMNMMAMPFMGLQQGMPNGMLSSSLIPTLSTQASGGAPSQQPGSSASSIMKDIKHSKSSSSKPLHDDGGEEVETSRFSSTSPAIFTDESKPGTSNDGDSDSEEGVFQPKGKKLKTMNHSSHSSDLFLSKLQKREESTSKSFASNIKRREKRKEESTKGSESDEDDPPKRGRKKGSKNKQPTKPTLQKKLVKAEAELEALREQLRRKQNKDD